MPADYPYARAQEQDLQDEDTGAGCERRRTAEEWPGRGRRAALERRRRGAWVRPSVATGVGAGTPPTRGLGAAGACAWVRRRAPPSWGPGHGRQLPPARVPGGGVAAHGRGLGVSRRGRGGLGDGRLGVAAERGRSGEVGRK